MTRIFSRVIVVLLTVLLIVGGVTLLPSCREGDGEQVTLAKMDIIDATHLFIAPGSGNKLFKITETGYIQEVIYEDEVGSNVTMVEEPVAIYDVDSEYVIVCFGVNDIDISEGYLVRKSSGAVFSLEDAGFPIPNTQREYNGFSTPAYFKNVEAVFTDSSGNIYYLAQSVGGVEIVKLNTQSTDSITKIGYSPSVDDVWIFIVDKDGNAAYLGCVKGDTSRTFARIRTAQGGIYDDVFDFHNPPWLGADGLIYWAYLGEAEPGHPEHPVVAVEKISINATSGVPTSSVYSVFEVEESVDLWIPGCHKLELQGRVLLAQSVPKDHILELYNPANSGRSLNIAAFNLSRLYSAVASDNFYYLHGSNSSTNEVLVKVDPTDDSYTALLSTDEYCIYTMSTSSSDELIFNALRMSDGVNVIGKFDVSGNLTILDEESDVEMVVLERIQ